MGLFRKTASRTAQRAAPANHLGPEFAVIDIETTGLDRQQDRMIELAIVIADANGNASYEWTSLINPGIDTAGPTRIHGITDEMVAVAPRFETLAADVAYMLSGRILVGHNIDDFDSVFLCQAFHRAGFPLGDNPLILVDTMDIADRLGLPRRLSNLCAELGIFFDPHSALDDARVTLEVFKRMLQKIDRRSFNKATNPAAFACVTSDRGGSVLTRAGAAALLTPRDLVKDAAFRFKPTDAEDAAIDEYRSYAHECLDDASFNADVGVEMIDFAVSLGLSARQARDAHHEVLTELFDVALGDNRISKSERLSLENTAKWLGVTIDDFDAWVKAGRLRRKEAQKVFRERVRGQTVVITGRGVHPNNIREALALKHGFTMTNTYRKGCDLVVVGSEETATAAVNMARADGVPLMTESLFWRRLGDL